MKDKAKTLEMAKDFKLEKKQAIQIAKDLCYSAAVIELIQLATCTVEITKALQVGRFS